MPFDEFFIAVSTEAPNLSEPGLRLLLHLCATALEQGAYSLAIPDREVCKNAAISHGAITKGKAEMARMMRVESRPRQLTVYHIPSTWFPLQAGLFSTVRDPGNGSRPLLVVPVRDPGNGSGLTPKMGHRDPGNGSRDPGNGPGLTPEMGHVTPEMGHRDPGNGPGFTQNQQLTDPPSNIDISNVLPTIEVNSVFSIYRTRRLTEKQRPEAAALAPALQRFMQLHGNQKTAEKPPDDVVLAQCLATAPLQELLHTLERAKLREARPNIYPWFVTTFLEELHGIPRSITKQLRQQLRNERRRKQAQTESGQPFATNLVTAAAAGVKTLR